MYYILKDDFLKDERIEVKDGGLIDNVKVLIFKLKPLESYCCPTCGSSNIIKYGHRIKKIKYELISENSQMLFLEYSRLRCKKCLSIFNDSTESINIKENIPLITKLRVLNDLKKDYSFKSIAEKHNISAQTVINIFDNMVDDKRLPFEEVLCFDEFKNLKSEDGKYAFLILDPLNKTVIDVLKDRKLETLKRYFNNIDINERYKVKYIITDMYEGYRSIVNLYFPNARHIVDSFHFIRYVTDAFNKVRIRIMNSYSIKSKEYRNLKRYWKVLIKYSKDIKFTDDLFFNYISNKKDNIYKIIDDTININEELNESYIYKESFLKGFKETRYEDARKYINDWINLVRKSEIPEFKELMKTFINWENEIVNSFIRFGERRLHNAYIEGANNHIKVIKRVSFGYRNFKRFRKRIMYIINKKTKIKI